MLRLLAGCFGASAAGASSSVAGAAAAFVRRVALVALTGAGAGASTTSGAFSEGSAKEIIDEMSLRKFNLIF